MPQTGPRPPSPYGVFYFSAPLQDTNATAYTPKHPIRGKGLRIIRGTREAYSLRFHRGNGAHLDFPGPLYDGLVLSVEFDALSFIFGDVTSAPAAAPWIFEIYENRTAVVAGSEHKPRPLLHRPVFRSTVGGHVIAAATGLSLYDSSADNLFPPELRAYQESFQPSRDWLLSGWVQATGDFDVYLLAQSDINLGAGAEAAVIARFDATNHAAIPAAVSATASQFNWIPGRNLTIAAAVGEMAFHGGITIPRAEWSLVAFNPGAGPITLRGRLDLNLLG